MSLDSLEYIDESKINGCNLYVYCGNGPVNCSDGSGHMPEWAYWALGAVVLVGIIGTAVLSGGATLTVGAAIGASVGAGVGVLTGITYDCAGVRFDSKKAASGFLFGAITGAISGLAGAHFSDAIEAGSLLARGAMALIDGILSLGTYIGQTALEGNINDITIVGSLISFSTGLLDFCEPFGDLFDYIWSPMMGAALGWGYDLIYNGIKNRN